MSRFVVTMLADDGYEVVSADMAEDAVTPYIESRPELTLHAIEAVR